MTEDEGIDYEALREIVTASVKPAGSMSSRALSLAASSGRNPDLIRNFLKNGTKPNFQSVHGICDALELSPVLFLRDWSGPLPQKKSWLPVICAVEAGVWRNKRLWERSEWYDVRVSYYPDDQPINGCVVRGRSMDRTIPPGTVLKCGMFGGMKGDDADGRYVIISRYTGSLQELTCRRMVQDRLGHWELRQESYLADFEEPIRINVEDTELGIRSVTDLTGEEIDVLAVVTDAYLPLNGLPTRPTRKYGTLPAFSD